MPNLISKIVEPWYPATAIGLEKGSASVVHLEKGRGNTCTRVSELQLSNR